MSLTGTEILYVLGALSNGAPSGETEPVTTQQIANLSSGGGAVLTQKTISSGSTDTETSGNMLILWNSATASNKTQTIPTSSGSMKTFIISDIYGTAGQYPITTSPVSGSIIGVNEVYTPCGSITLIDSTNGWVSV